METIDSNILEKFQNDCEDDGFSMDNYTNEEFLELIHNYWLEFTTILRNNHPILRLVGKHVMRIYDEANDLDNINVPSNRESIEFINEGIFRLSMWMAAYSPEFMAVISRISQDMVKELSLYSTTEREETVMHIACFYGNVECIIHILKVTKIKKIKELILCQDRNGLTPLHKACLSGENESVRALLTTQRFDADTKRLLVLKTDDVEKSRNKGKTALHLACSVGHEKCVRALLENVPEETREVLVMVKDQEGQLALHKACVGRKAKCVKAILKNIPKTSLKYVLLDQDNKGKDAIALSEWKCTEAIMSVIYADIEMTTSDMMLPTILSRKNKFKYSFYGSEDHLADNINVLDQCKKNVTYDKFLSDCFPDFDLTLNTAEWSFGQTSRCHPLRIISLTKNMALIKHPYVQAYIDTCWKKFARYILWLNVFLYIMFFILLSCYVSSHQFSAELHNSTSNMKLNAFNSSESNKANKAGGNPAFEAVAHFFFHSHSFNLNYTQFCRYATLILAVVLLVYEFIQMYAKRRYYFFPDIRSRDWICIENYIDLALFLGAIAITTLPSFTEYSPWIHEFGCCLILVGLLRGSWLLTHVQLVGDQFLMLLRVVQKVLVFSPVILSFVVTFSVLFHNLLANQKVFSDIGTSLAKVLIMMTIGELEFENLFVSDENEQSFETLANILIVAFVVLMTVSMMNLLIGVAVGDIRELGEKGESLGFLSKVDLILQYAYMFPSITDRIHKKTFEKLHFHNLFDDDDITNNEEFSLEMYFDQFEKEYRKYRPKETKEMISLDETDLSYSNVEDILKELKVLKDKIENLEKTRDNN